MTKPKHNICRRIRTLPGRAEHVGPLGYTDPVETSRIRRRVKVVADTRELRSGVIAALRGDPDIDLRVRQHKVGDYWLDDSIAVERKSCRDFYASIFDGRVFSQASRLRRAAGRCLLVIEGLGFSRAFSSPPPWLSGALVTLTAGYQLPILPSRGVAHTAQLLRLLALQQLEERMGEPAFPKGPRLARSTERLLRQRVLQGVPLVGPRRATALLDRFTTLGAIFSAGPEELRAIHGIGPDVAATIAWLGAGADHVREERAPYAAGVGLAPRAGGRESREAQGQDGGSAGRF